MAEAVKAPASAEELEMEELLQLADQVGGKKKKGKKPKGPKLTKEEKQAEAEARAQAKEQERLDKAKEKENQAKAKQREAAKKKAAKQQAAANKQGKKGFMGLVVLFVLLIGAAVFLYFSVINDWGGVRTSILTTVNRLDPGFRYAKEEQLAEYNRNVEAVEAAQKQLNLDIAAFEKSRAEQNAALDKRKKELDEQEIFTLPLYRQGLSDDKIDEIKQLAKIYENMDAEDAADIMSRLYDVSHMAAILFYMKPAPAADVMSSMPADLAARVTTELLRE